MWQQWANGVLGLWVIAVPFLGMTAQQNMWALVVTGVVVAAFGFWGATEHQMWHEHRTRMA